MRHSIPTTSLFLFALLAGCATPADESAGSPSDRVAGSQQMHQIEEDPDQRSDEEQKLQFQIEERERAEREAADLKAAREAADQAAKEEAEKRAAMEADAQAQREAEEAEAAKRAEEEEADRQAAAQEAAAEEAAAQEAAEAGSEASDDPDPQHSADAPPPLYGQITADGAAVAGARICIRGTEICEWSGDDGYFKLNGLEDGISEELVVDAPDFPVVIAPIELFPSEYRWLELPLPPRGQTHVDVGAVYVASQGHIEFGVQAKPVDGSWKLVESSLDIQRDSREATELMNDIRPGLYEAHFTPTDSADCLRVLGWANPDANGQHLSMLVPVYGGAVTVIAKVCAAY